jgi:DNA-binding cell septation regulator SpoVG
MPRGRPRKDQTPEAPQENQSPRDQVPVETETQESTIHEGIYQDEQQTAPETGAPLERMSFKAREYLGQFGYDGLIPEDSLLAAIKNGISDFFGNDPDVVLTIRQELEQAATPAELRNPIPLDVRITSLEMDGSTRAFASADYGDLTINRIRVKQDESGTLSVSMPRFRQSNGWKDTCRFNTIEARNRISGAVLDAYERQMAQTQGQAHSQFDAEAPEQFMDQSESQESEGQEQEGPVMGMSQL